MLRIESSAELAVLKQFAQEEIQLLQIKLEESFLKCWEKTQLFMHNESLKSNSKLDWFAQNDKSRYSRYHHLLFLRKMLGRFNSHESANVDGQQL